MTEKLLPCTCCGGEAAINTTRTTCRETIKLNKRDTGYGVNCVVCGINNQGLVLGYESEELASEAWNRRAAQPSVPDGWRLVPEDPTEEMIVAFVEQWYCHRQSIDDPQMGDAYQAMLEAAHKFGEEE